MPYEIFNFFSRCSETHGAHSTLKDAAACFNQLTLRYGGDIPVHPISQKYVFWIVAIDRKGNQRNFSTQDRESAKVLCLNPRSIETDIPGVTTFSHLAKMYYEALRLIPVLGINLKGMFDYKVKNRHFWTSDAGKGQALAYAQQAAFTLELSLKAYLEILGKLASPNIGNTQEWHKHELADLFNLLTAAEKKQLEKWWNDSETKRSYFNGSFREFVSGSNKLYLKWRYITDLRSPDLSIDIPMLLSASDFLLSASDQVFQDSSPIEVNITTETYPNTEESDGRPAPRSLVTLVEGRVRTVKIPDGFDPHGIVELAIESDQHEEYVIAQFYKRNVKDYYGLEGERVALVGEIREDEPHLLPFPSHVDEPKRKLGYTYERRILRGSIYDIGIVQPAYAGSEKVDLALWDETFFTRVECFFATDQEREELKDISLGDKVLISGSVTLLNGNPMLLVGPERIEKLAEDREM